jgi:hypothetical protein
MRPAFENRPGSIIHIILHKFFYRCLLLFSRVDSLSKLFLTSPRSTVAYEPPMEIHFQGRFTVK